MLKVLIFSLLISTTSFAKSFLPEKFSASFNQIYKSELTGKVKKSSITIDYLYPSNIRLETNSPSGKTSYISNSKQSWYYTPPFIEGQPGQVTIQSDTKNILTKTLDVLRKGLVSNKVYKVDNKDNVYTLTFLDNYKKDLGLVKTVLTFKGKDLTFSNLSSLEMTQTDSKVKKLELVSVKENPNFSSKHFIFEVPKNTKINR